MELSNLFEKFSKEISLTEAMRKELITGHKTLSERISQDETLSKIFVTSFLQGSYRRETAVRPKGDSRSDVDVVVVTDLDGSTVKPDSALDRFRPFLDRWYPGKHRAQGRSWGIELSNVSLDLVVTSTPSAAARKKIQRPSGDSTLENEAEWQSAWKDEPLKIPDRKAQSWIETNPLQQIQWTHDKNKRTNGYYIGVVRALKWWRRLHDQPRHPKSYPLEHMIGDCCPDDIKSVAEGVTRTLEAIAARYGSELAAGTVPTSWDRGVRQNVFKRISAPDFRAFHELSASAARTARTALDSPDRIDSARAWRGLLGDKFPLT